MWLHWLYLLTSSKMFLFNGLSPVEFAGIIYLVGMATTFCLWNWKLPNSNQLLNSAALPNSPKKKKSSYYPLKMPMFLNLIFIDKGSPSAARTKVGMESVLDLFPPVFIPIVLPMPIWHIFARTRGKRWKRVESQSHKRVSGSRSSPMPPKML